MGKSGGNNVYDVIQAIAESIAGPLSHGFEKHHLKKNEFRDERLGPVLDINDHEDLVRHAYKVLTDPDSRVIHTGDLLVYVYHPASKTLCIVNPARADLDGGTIYRLDPKTDGAGPEWHTHVTAYEARRLGVSGFKDQAGGLLLKLRQNPALAKDLRNAYEDTSRLRLRADREQQAEARREEKNSGRKGNDDRDRKSRRR
jgi:hypothetical protein